MKKTAISLLALMAAICTVQARPHVPFIEINARQIEETLLAAADSELAGKPQWSLAQLLGRCTAQMPKGMTGSLGTVRPSQAPLSAEETYDRCGRAILMFCNYYDCGQCDRMHIDIGASATVLSPDGICLTNYHVMEDIIRGNTETLEGHELYFVGTRDGRCYPITHVLAYSEHNDTAIFKVDTRGDTLPFIPLGETALTGSEVRVVSNPHGLPYYYSQGVVALNMKYSQEGRTVRRMQISADFAVGSSGSAILDRCGNLVGMVASTNSVYYDPQNRSGLQMILKTTIPVADIKELLGLESGR